MSKICTNCNDTGEIDVLSPERTGQWIKSVCPECGRPGSNRNNVCTAISDCHWIESVARAFHEAYERLAPEYNYKTRTESAVPWEQVPESNRQLMIAVVRDIFEKQIKRVGTVNHK